MKQMKKILSIVLILSALVMLLSACGSKGEIVAVYNNTPVYEEDVQDIINYYILTNATLDTTDEEKSEMAKEAVRTYVRYKVLEIDLKKKGYTVDEKALNQTVKEMIEYLDKNFTGGYKDWRNMYGLSKNFLKEDMRRYELASLFNEYASTTIEVTDEEIETYYHANGGAYADPAGYTWTGVLREVFDLKDEEECAAAEAEMENYIRQINAGDDIGTGEGRSFGKIYGGGRLYQNKSFFRRKLYGHQRLCHHSQSFRCAGGYQKGIWRVRSRRGSKGGCRSL